MAPYKRQWVVHVKWKKEKGDINDIRPEYYGPFDKSETEVTVWMKRFANVNQGQIESITHHPLIKP